MSDEDLRSQCERDERLLTKLLEDHADGLTGRETEAFGGMLKRLRERPLTERQREWVEKVASRFGAADDPGARNVFSSMDPAKQAEMRRRASAVVMPWERPGHKRPLKPPGR